ncbi:MAG: pyridoxamine 5'-phosphate oxidase family protein [Hyphomicrobiaceae bacterium]
MDRGSPPSARTRVKRYGELGRYDRPTIDAILDAMPVCTVGYVVDGSPFVTPTLQWREGDTVYWHGSAASRMLETAEDAEVCLNVTILDGIVLARSAFNHSVNYRSVMLLGRARRITDLDAKRRHLETFVDRLTPGRWAMLRPMTEKEMKATTVLALPIAEASAKVSEGMPTDDEADYAWPVWAGVIPLRTEVLAAEADPRNLEGVARPPHLDDFHIG